jgi:peptide-methionine (R)-S-oxide reductase
MNRRGVLAGILAVVAAVPIVRLFAGTDADESGEIKAKGSDVEKIEKTESQWREILTEQEFDVLRNEATERAGASPLNNEKRAGTFTCAGCALPLFKTEWKFESGTGWPSFWDHIKGHLETKTDYKLILPRTEYHCARCGGHQGHVFKDGPAPTGERWCNNGVALNFVPADQA